MKKFKRLLNRIFPKKFPKYWKEIEYSENIDDTLRYITNNFIDSKSYNLVSNYWHILNIENYKSLSLFGIKKYGSTIAKNYYTFTEIYHDEWFDGAVNNIKDNSFKIDSKEAFKKQDEFSLKESIS